MYTIVTREKKGTVESRVIDSGDVSPYDPEGFLHRIIVQGFTGD
jgi:hypothetical protein